MGEKFNKKIIEFIKKYDIILIIQTTIGITFYLMLTINAENIYEILWKRSLQFWFMLFSIGFLLFFPFIMKHIRMLNIDTFNSDYIKTYTLIIVSFIVTYIGIMGIAISILNGTLYAAVVTAEGPIRQEFLVLIRKQGFTLVLFTIYSTMILVINTIFPLIKRFNQSSSSSEKPTNN